MYEIDNGKGTLKCYDLADNGRNFMFEVYEVSENHDALRVLQNLENYAKKLPTMKAVYIKHDKDIKDDGEVVKPHYHVAIKLENKTTARSIRKHLELPEVVHLVQFDDFQNTVLYFLHWEN